MVSSNVKRRVMTATVVIGNLLKIQTTFNALVGDDFDPVHFNHPKDSNPPMKILTTIPVPVFDDFEVDENDADDILIFPVNTDT